MSFTRKLSGAAKWLWHKIIRPIMGEDRDGDGAPDILQDALEIARTAVEPLVGLDLNGDGRVAAIQEILAVAAATGSKWGRKLLANGGESARSSLASYQNSDLKRYLALARLTAHLIQKYGPALLPKTPILNAILETALVALDSES